MSTVLWLISCQGYNLYISSFSGVTVCSLNGPVRNIFISAINKSQVQREIGNSKGDIGKVETQSTHFHLPTPVANTQQEFEVFTVHSYSQSLLLAD